MALATRLVQVAGGRVGLVRRTRFGATCEQAIEVLWADLPVGVPVGVPGGVHKRLYVVEAGIATVARLAAATEQVAVWGRQRINAKRRCAPALCPGAVPGQARARATAAACGHPTGRSCIRALCSEKAASWMPPR